MYLGKYLSILGVLTSTIVSLFDSFIIKIPDLIYILLLIVSLFMIFIGFYLMKKEKD